MASLAIANTILAQLGGGQFRVMTGASQFLAIDEPNPGVLFRIGTGAKDRINKVRVSLTPADTYTVEFFYVRGTKVVKVSEVENVYCDNLREVFTRVTGFETRL